MTTTFATREAAVEFVRRQHQVEPVVLDQWEGGGESAIPCGECVATTDWDWTTFRRGVRQLVCLPA